jgi:hypothetical protein
MAKEFRLNIRINKELYEFLQNKGNITQFVESVLLPYMNNENVNNRKDTDYLSKINWEAIKELSTKYRVHPDLLVDAAVLYFDQLDPSEQKRKLAYYLEHCEKHMNADTEKE